MEGGVSAASLQASQPCFPVPCPDKISVTCNLAAGSDPPTEAEGHLAPGPTSISEG